MTSIVRQRKDKSLLSLGKENRLVIPEITPEYIRRELIKAEMLRRQQVQVAKKQVARKEEKPHFNPEEYDIKEEEE